MNCEPVIRFAAVGDLLLSNQTRSNVSGRGLESLSNDVKKLFASCNVVFANLECTLPGTETVSTEPRVISSVAQIHSLKDTGIEVVTLGNNHMFDCMEDGFIRLSEMLKTMGIHWFGAGRNVEEALFPLVLEVKGIRLAFLGVVDESAGPYRFANQTQSGVARLDTETICRIIRNLKSDVNHVIVSPHWGRERFRIPSLKQIEQAHAFIDAGASMVLGHHPHVLQGMEIYKGGPIVYSLGNFFANNVYWENGDIMTWSRFERTSCIFFADLDQESVYNVQQIPVMDDGEKVFIDRSKWGENCLQRANRLLAKGVTPRRYALEEFYVEKIKPIISHLRWSELKRIQPRHFRKALQMFLP